MTNRDVRWSIDSSENKARSLSWSLDLEESMRVVNFAFTFLTEIEVFTNTALVADTNKWEDITAITSNS